MTRDSMIGGGEKQGNTMQEGERSVSLRVEGMDCEDEVRLIERKLRALRGVGDFETILMAERLNVRYDPSQVSVQDIIRSIAEAGMRAKLSDDERRGGAGDEEGRPTYWWKQGKILLLALSGIITVTAFTLERFGLPENRAIALYLAATLVGGYYPARNGIPAIKTLTLNLNTLLVAAASGAIALGLWEEAAVLVFVYSLGGVLETYAVEKARGSLRSLMGLIPSKTLVKRGEGMVELPVSEVEPGDVIIVRPGEKVPLDGVVVAGGSYVDQSAITGEAMPVSKGEGDDLFAGTINQRGSLEVEVTRLSGDTTLARIIHQVEKAQAKKSSYQRFGEKFGKYYTPSMFALALAVALLPALVLGQGFSQWFYRGLVILVVSCSCGLVLSVPVSTVATISTAARKGILIKGGASLEMASRIGAVAFDKTGTLTIGRPEVTDIIPLNGQVEAGVLALAAAIESRSEHPLAETILRRAREEEVPIPAAEGFQSIPGMGARVEGRWCSIGSSRLFQDRGDIITPQTTDIMSTLEDQGKTVVLLGDEGEIKGLVAVRDRLRPEVKQALAELKRAGIGKIVMLTGDNEGTARAIAAEAGVDECHSRLLPLDKVESIKRLKRDYGGVAMVGDGINDAPALAEADLGIAMGAAGTDVAMETGDVALMTDDLTKLPLIFSLSRRAVNNMKQNIAAALIIVAFIVPAALLGRVGLVSGLLINELSALMVITNALRLLR